MILLSLASKQIWPHILLLAHPKPQRLFLLHSPNQEKSKTPAQRLKHFLDETGLVPAGQTRLESIADNDFHAVEQQLDQFQSTHHLPLPECLLNSTGRNKPMATAAFRWATPRGLCSCYLERRHTLTRFTPRDGEIHTRLQHPPSPGRNRPPL